MSRQRTTASLECSGGTLKEKDVQQSAFVGRIVAAFINKHASKSILVVQLKPRDWARVFEFLQYLIPMPERARDVLMVKI
jgi:hypothetical protein